MKPVGDIRETADFHPNSNHSASFRKSERAVDVKKPLGKNLVLLSL
jgi:hypothetical protein